jgi:hypothetical protein
MEWTPTPQQQETLQQQSFLEELLKRRSGESKAVAEPAVPKPKWQAFLESTGGTALITVVLGTFGGAVITNLIQTANQKQQTRQLSLSEYLKGEHDTVQKVFDIVGQAIAVSDNLNTITTNGFNPGNFEKGEQANLVIQQKELIRDQFNKLDEQWRATRETLTLNMRYYHGNDPTLSSVWDDTSNKLTGYMNCQQAWYIKQLGSFVDNSVADKACNSEKKSLDGSLQALSEALAKNRLYEWGAPHQ